MTEVRHDAGAQLHRIKIGAAAKNTGRRNRCSRTVVSVDVTVVDLEETKAEAIVEERQVVIHATASGQRRAPAVGLVLKRRRNVAVRAAEASATYKAVGEEREVLHREPDDWTGRSSGKSIVIAIGMI